MERCKPGHKTRAAVQMDSRNCILHLAPAAREEQLGLEGLEAIWWSDSSPQVQGEASLACCHFWPLGCGVVRADAKEPRKKDKEHILA